MNLVFFGIIIFILVFVLLSWFAKTSSKRIAKHKGQTAPPHQGLRKKASVSSTSAVSVCLHLAEGIPGRHGRLLFCKASRIVRVPQHSQNRRTTETAFRRLKSHQLPKLKKPASPAFLIP